MATVLVRSNDAETIACELHAERLDGEMVAVLRLADDPDVRSRPMSRPARIVTAAGERRRLRGIRPACPRRDARPRRRTALRSDFVACTLTPASNVTALVDRPPRRGRRRMCLLDGWWLDDAAAGRDVRRRRAHRRCERGGQAAARQPAHRPSLAGVRDGRVAPAGSPSSCPIIRQAGVVNSRFRMPRDDGSLVEFDSHTEVHGRLFRTVMRLRP